MTFSALILAGGKSSRMGRDKAWLRVGHETLLGRQIRLAREIGAAEVFISGRAGVDYSHLGCRVLKDKIPDAGPLAGIERGLNSVSTQFLLVLAVDLPMMCADCLLRISAHTCGLGAIPVVAGQIEPLAGFYPKSARSLAGALLRDNNRAVAAFAARCVETGLAQFVELPLSDVTFFENFNSPAQLALLTDSDSSSQVR